MGCAICWVEAWVEKTVDGELVSEREEGGVASLGRGAGGGWMVGGATLVEE